MRNNTKMLFAMLDIENVRSSKSFSVATMKDLHQKKDCYKRRSHKLHLMNVVNKIELMKLPQNLWMI